MSIKDRLDEEREAAVAWRPEPDQELIGEVVAINSRTTENGTYPIVTVREVDGELAAFHAFHSVAKNELELEKPTPGNEIGIRYLGLQEGGKFPYHGYRIVVEHAPRSPADGESLATTQAATQQERDGQGDQDDIPF